MILAANFKTNHTRASTKAYINGICEFVANESYDLPIMIFPPATALDTVALPGNVTAGVQNAYPVASGSFTGEIGTQQLDEFGIKTVLIGHSERRHILGESQEFIAKKYQYFRDEGYTIVYCIGEPLEIREQGDDAVKAYLEAQMVGIDAEYDHLVLAYEPVWAIGTGRTATPELIASTHAMVKAMSDRPLLYGGSVKPANTKEILSVEGCDGVLVGTASWELESFTSMLKTAKELQA